MNKSHKTAGKSQGTSKSTIHPRINPIRRAIESLESRRLLDGTGLLAQYFNTTDLTGTPVSRVDANVNFNWTNGAPDNQLNPDNYSARWTGKVQANYSETYTFSVNVTGGARLWVNGTQLINQWSATGTNTFTGTIALTAGTRYDIQLEYAEKTGNAAVSLSWSSASQSQQVIPQSALYGWNETDIGSPASAGSSTYNSSTGTFTISGSGNYWLTSSDTGHTLYQQITGDAQITIRIASVSSTSMLTGLFIRNSMDANSSGAMIDYWSNSIWSVARMTNGQNVDGGVANNATAAGLWLKLVRVGNTLTGYISPDGQRWEAQWGRNVTMNDTVYVGMFASSNSSSLATATIDNVSVRSYWSDYQTSWLGNSGNGAGQWVQNDFKGIFIDQFTGEIFINSPYDEGAHEAARYLNGVNTGAMTDLHGWARSGGWGITADASYVYLTMNQGNPGWSDASYPPSGSNWNCIRRYDRTTLRPAGWTGGSGYDSSMLIVNTSGSLLTGMVMIGNNLYVSDPTTNQVKIYNKTTMTSAGSFSVARPGHMAVDGSNNIWIVSYADGSNAAKILKYDSSGNKLTPEITGVESPMGIAYNSATGQLLVTDDGARQQVLKYSNLTAASPTLAGTLGDYGGIASGTPGAVTPTKFDNPSTVAADASGNIYVGFNGLKADYTNASIIGIGSVLRSFNSSGTMNWEMHGLEFVDSAAIDPASNGLTAYTKDERFTMDYSKLGQEMGTWVGRTVDETTNAGDPRLTGDGTSVWIKTLGGQTFMVTTGQGGGSVRFYKKVAGTELWKLSADIQELAYNGIPYTTIWRDTNNDGIKQSSEVVNSNVSNKDDGFGFDIDSQGNVWSSGYYSAIRKYVFTGLDGNGNPTFSTSVQQQSQSTIFNRLGRVAYDTATDTMYISGWTAANPFGAGDWGMAGSVIARYNNWSTSATLAWSTVMPYNPSIYDNAKAISLAGNRLFVGFVSTGSVRAYDTATGALVEDMARGSEIGGYGGWLDTSQPINSFRRSNGMYVITVEDDLLGKVYVFTAGGIMPTNLTATAASSSQINLSWTDNDSKESGFVVQRSTDGTNFTDIATLPANMTSYSATGLSTGTTYYFRVRANNSFDNSPWSSVASATTSGSAPAAPSGLSATAASSSQINLSWTDNSSNETGFSIDRATNSTFTTGLVTTTVGAGVTSSNITGLTASTTYYFRVKATGASGDSAYTSTASATTQAASLGQFSAQSDIGSVGVAGTGDYSGGVYTLTGSGADIWETADGFHYMYSSLNGDGEIIARVNSLSNSDPWAKSGVMIRESLTAGSAHAMMVITAGNGAAFQYRASTGAASGHVAGAAVTAPYWVRLTRVGNVLTGYSSSDGTTWTQVGQTTISMATSVYMGLAVTSHNNSTYTTTAFQQVTVSTLPAAPTGLSATVASSSQLNLSWTDNSNNETGFSIDRATNSSFTTGLVTNSVGANVTTYNVTGLSANTTYYFRVRATGSAGNSAYTSTASATTLPTAPAAPSGLSATAASSTQINLTWTDNASNETGFSIDRATDSGFTANLVTNSVGANVTTYNATGLTANTTYYFRVRATNTGGNSAYTSTASATTQGTAPTAPSGLSATANSSTQIFLTWYDNSSDETGFQIDVATVSDFSTMLGTIPLGSNTNNNMVSYLTPNTTYYFRIRATGTGGNSANSNTASAATLSDAPAAPTGLSATTASATQINLSWTDNASNETGFSIDRATDSGFTTYLVTNSVGANVTTYNATDLTANTTYYFRVRATNTGGNSAYTSTASATTLPTAPAAPSGLGATAASSTQINLSWTDNASNETGFSIDRATDSGFTTNLVTNSVGANVTTYNATGLTANTTYYFRVRATNTGGNSAYTSTASATTLPTAPAAPSGLSATAASSTQINLAWTDNASNETGFSIDRATDSGFTANLVTNSVGANVTTYNATSLTANTTYYFRVRATNTGGNSAYTSTASATTQGNPPAAPSGLTASTSSSTSIFLTWYDNSSDETGFQIDVSTVSDFSSILGTVPLGSNTNNTTISYLTPSTTYYFRVRAIGTGGNSANSNTASANTSA